MPIKKKQKWRKKQTKMGNYDIGINSGTSGCGRCRICTGCMNFGGSLSLKSSGDSYSQPASYDSPASDYSSPSTKYGVS